MNYRHAFHAGNHADVVKHMVLVFCLDHLKRKPAPFSVLDAHAGRGRYDLRAAEAQRSPEWRDGVGKLWGWSDAPPLIARYLETVRVFNADGGLLIYPGSPLIAAAALRRQDACAACELQEDEHDALRALFGRERRVNVHRRDGYEAMGALLPPAQKRGLVLIDPPYEADDEILRAVAALKSALKRFAHGVYVWWRPLKQQSALAMADADLVAPGLCADFWLDDPAANAKLVGSSLRIVNPPFGLEAALAEALPALATRLGTGASGWTLTGSA